MKGPAFQLELKIYRLWDCPACHRTVRTRGSVTSRFCSCTSPPTTMHLLEPNRRVPFDATPFVHYMTEEFTTPTAEELREDLPERKVRPVDPANPESAVPPKDRLRRGKGYLRAEASPAEASHTNGGSSPTAESNPPSESFGAGIEDPPETPADESPVVVQDAEETPLGDPVISHASESRDGGATIGPGQSSSGERKSRNRRRRGKKRDHGAASSATADKPKRTEPTAKAGTTQTSDTAGNRGDSPQRGEETADGKSGSGRRRRRRRRGRKGGSAEGSAGNAS